MPTRIDLHTHTTASDGALAPEALVQAALDAGLEVIAVTDHDTVEGIGPSVAAAAGTGLRVLPGVELSVLHDGRSLHLLGYGFDPTATLAHRLRAFSMGREERAQLILDILAGLGLPLSMEQVRRYAKGTVARPAIARALVEAGHARDVPDAFDRLIGEGCPAYLPSGHLGAAEAIALVREAGGAVALAHSQLPAHPLDLDTVLPELCRVGLSGLEVYHSEHDAATTERLRRRAEAEGLWWCGGSDFHGPTKPHASLGGVAVPPEVLEQGPFPAALYAQP